MRQETLRRFISFGLLVLLVIIFSVTTDSFLNWGNINTLLRECSVTGILAIGVTMAIITGGNDLSCGHLMGTVCMLFSFLYYYTGMSLLMILALTLLLALMGGLLNGFSVAVLQIPDFIATLSSQFIFAGLTYIFAIRNEYGSITQAQINNPTITALGGQIGKNGPYFVTIAFFVMAAIAQFFLKKTKRGTYIYAMGANRKSAEYSGVSFVKTKITAFVISGFCAFVAAMFTLGRLHTAEVATGQTLALQAISATVIGGAAFTGGRGDMVGTTIGVLFMQVLRNGMRKYGFTTQVVAVVSGIVIVLVLVFDAYYNEFMQKRIKRAAAAAREKKAVSANG
ncbi:MAG: ABC transporter permease [Lachnospiraceae bacterium]|nr:ABC transporter permease [Lachnospiraceae bacterium]